MTSTILGASRLEQLHDNLASLELGLTPEQLGALNEVSAPESGFSQMLGTPQMTRIVFGGETVKGWRSS